MRRYLRGSPSPPSASSFAEDGRPSGLDIFEGPARGDCFESCRVFLPDRDKGGGFVRRRIRHLARALAFRHPPHRIETGADDRVHLPPICGGANAPADAGNDVPEWSDKWIEVLCWRLKVEGQ